MWGLFVVGFLVVEQIAFSFFLKDDRLIMEQYAFFESSQKNSQLEKLSVSSPSVIDKKEDHVVPLYQEMIFEDEFAREDPLFSLEE